MRFLFSKSELWIWLGAWEWIGRGEVAYAENLLNGLELLVVVGVLLYGVVDSLALADLLDEEHDGLNLVLVDVG